MLDNSNNKKLVLIGYSGHSLGVIEAWLNSGGEIKGYIDLKEKTFNPFNISYLGNDFSPNLNYQKDLFHLSIGDLLIRRQLIERVEFSNIKFQTVISPEAKISQLTTIESGTFIARGASINPMVKIGKNCIINTSCVIEHEVEIGDNSHIAPGAVLAGNIKIGNNVFIGANSVLKQNISIGNNTIIGAGAVVIGDIGNNQRVVGNPGKEI